METESLILQLLDKADGYKISDIHVMPEGMAYKCYFRRNGTLELERVLSEESGRRLISYLKFKGNMDVGEKRRPQSGSAILPVNGQPKDLRFSTMTNFRQEESLVIRLLSKADQLDLAQHAFFQREVNQMKQLVRYKSGLLLFSGSVGSGKTTTMYHLVRQAAIRDQQQVITVEDPVELEEPSFLQCQVNEKAGIYFETLLKSSLRHHPDILIVGEIRDEETAKMVIRGALTGHLILASVHARNAEGVMERMMELGVSKNLLRQTLLGIVFQKLLPRQCPFCHDRCSLYCNHLKAEQKRAALYDVWTGNRLDNLFKQEAESRQDPKSFNQLIRKAWAYGFITDTTYHTFRIP